MLHAQLGVSTMEEISMTDVMGDNEAQLTNLMELLPDRIDAKKQSLHPWPYKKKCSFSKHLIKRFVLRPRKGNTTTGVTMDRPARAR